MRKGFFILSLIILCPLHADELPTRLLSSQHSSIEACIKWKTQQCNSFECITSEARDCQKQCQKKAANACKGEFGQE